MSSTTTPPSQDPSNPTLLDLNRRLSRVERRLARQDDADLVLRVAELEAYVAQQRVAELEARLAAVSVAPDLQRQSNPPPAKSKGKAKAETASSVSSSSSLSSTTTTSSCTTSPSVPSPAATPPRRSVPHPQYVYSTPEKGINFTSQWAEAGASTQGVPQGHVRRLFASPRDSSRRACFVVFRGYQVGVVDDWSAVQSKTSKFRCAVYSGYQSRADATRAFDHAVQAGLTSTTPPSPGELVLRASKTPRPITAHDFSLFGDRIRARGSQEPWYAVYIGIRPGVYATWLEAALNTMAVQGAVFHKAESFDDAVQRFALAEAEGHVKTQRTPVV
ncbi:hypothetical protein C8F01DRAFT_1235939 [Mycena amicta]|nr:hypothetical protein C8F01DRAFT_1235939 [Mycena amicta]